jgi:hypothetical protein
MKHRREKRKRWVRRAGTTPTGFQGRERLIERTEILEKIRPAENNRSGSRIEQ